MGFSQVAYMLVVTGIFSAHTISATNILQKARKINLPVIEGSIKRSCAEWNRRPQW